MSAPASSGGVGLPSWEDGGLSTHRTSQATKRSHAKACDKGQHDGSRCPARKVSASRRGVRSILHLAADMSTAGRGAEQPTIILLSVQHNTGVKSTMMSVLMQGEALDARSRRATALHRQIKRAEALGTPKLSTLVVQMRCTRTVPNLLIRRSRTLHSRALVTPARPCYCASEALNCRAGLAVHGETKRAGRRICL